MKLNPSQAAVVAARAPRILVLAGAGTGKTATSVHWVADLIANGARRSQMLMITFTRKGANEMAGRIEKLIAHVPRHGAQDKLTVGTYHAVASILLRKDGKKFGLTNNTFSTIDESECQSIWKSALKQCGLESKSALFVPNRLQQMLSLSRNTGSSLAEAMEAEFGSKHLKKMQKVVATYEELKKAANVADYDDLLVLWLDRMTREPEYAAALRQRWPYVLVDEMQDNNQINQALLDALNPPTLMVVGDANQSIYGFRGSDVSLIRKFATHRNDVATYKLESNYRSGQTILDLANAVVAGTPSALVLESARGTDDRIDYHCYGNPGSEAQGIFRWLEERKTAGHKPCESAILSRSSKALNELEITLNAHRIRYKKYGGQTIADSAEVKDFLSFLRVSHNVQDKIALLRALMQFPGIGEGTAAKVIAEHEGGFFGADYWPKPAEQLPEWIEGLRERKALKDKALYLEEQIKPLIMANYPKDGEERIGTLRAMVTAMEQLDTSLVDFLDGFTLNRSTNDWHPDDAVVLSTIHSSKGLEWDGVCLMGSGSCQIPHPRSLDSGDIEEERRLFYVAVTRARRHLLLTFPNTTDRGQGQKPCPFVPLEQKWQFFFS